MLVPTRLMIRENKGPWTSEMFPSFEHALLRWMRIPLRGRFGGLLSDASQPEPRAPLMWEYKHIGLLCITQHLHRLMHDRVTVRKSGHNIDPAEEHPHVETIIAFGEEIDERTHLSEPEDVDRWERGIERLTRAGPDNLLWARGRVPPTTPPHARPVEDVQDAEWVEIAETDGLLALPPPRAETLATALAGLELPVPGDWARAFLDAVPASFADDASAAAWARAASMALRTFAEAAMPATVPDPVDEASGPEAETVHEAEVREIPGDVEAVDETADAEPVGQDPPEDTGEPAPEPKVRRRPAPSKLPGSLRGTPLTGLETRTLSMLSTFMPMRKVEIARALDHGRGAVIRAVDGLVAKGAAADVGDGRYVRLIA